MRNRLRPEPRAASRRIAGLLCAGLIALAGCAAPRAGTKSPSAAPEQVFRALLGHNPGLSAVRAVVEARLSYAGREVTLPGVLQLDALGGFRLELLDPLDRPLAVFYAEQGRIVQYRPGLQLGASLGVLPAGCAGIDPADWVRTVIASSPSPGPGERLRDRAAWGTDRSLELHRGGELRRSIRYRTIEGRPEAVSASWYCEDEPVVKLRLRDWAGDAPWRLPTRLEIDYPKAGLGVRIDLREIEGNPPGGSAPLLPRPASSTRWTIWDLPR